MQSNPLRRSGPQVSKTEGKLRFWRARNCPAAVKSRRFVFLSSVKKICLVKLRQEDLPCKAPSRRFAFKREGGGGRGGGFSFQRGFRAVSGLRQEDLPFFLRAPATGSS